MVSLIAYKSVSDLVTALSEESKPNQKLLLLNEIISDLSDVESSVRTFSITRDTSHLLPFQRTVWSVEEKMKQLRQFDDDKNQKARLDSLDVLIEQKYAIQNELLAVEADAKVEEVLNRIIRNISAKEKEAITEVEKMKLSKLKELFRSKEKVEAFSTDELTDIQEMVTKLKKEELEKEGVVQQREFELTQADVNAMSRISALANEFEKAEIISAQNRAQRAERLANTATAFITVISVAAFLLVISLAYFVYTYITNTARHNKQLKDSKEHAEKLARVKEEFLANMSHEIRTPMNAILGFSEQLEKTHLDSRQKLYTGTIKDSIEHLLVMVNDILDHSKIESGTFAFENVGFKPVEVIRHVFESFLKMAQEKELTLRFEVDENIPGVLIGDPYRLKQILYNLIGNAIKFTDSGFVEIKAKSFPKETSAIELQIEVLDSGMGIPADKIENIFEDFFQLDSTSTRKYGGTGLGLAITKKLVELQNGTIQVRSEESLGSVFSFTIPYRVGSEIDVEEKVSMPDDPSKLLGNISALVVDDEEYNRMLLETILTRWGTKATLCDSGKNAIEALEKNNYHIVLMDVRMPEMSGLEATERIRNMKSINKSQVPILALTAAGSEQDFKRCKMAGMNDFLSKPFREAELFEKICSVLHIDFNGSPMQQSELSEAGGNKSYSLNELKRLGNGDENFVNEMINVFIQNTNEGMNKMKEAIEKKDWDKTGLYAHRIASPSRHLGMTSIVRKLKEIEINTLNKTNLETISLLFQSLEAEINTALDELQKEVG